MGHTVRVKNFCHQFHQLKKFLKRKQSIIPAPKIKQVKKLFKKENRVWHDAEDDIAIFANHETFFGLLTQISRMLEVEKLSWVGYLAPQNRKATHKVHLDIGTLGDVSLNPIPTAAQGHRFENAEGK